MYINEYGICDQSLKSDTTIGLRTTWDDGFEVVEEILLATGDLAHTETAESTPPPAKAVPRSEAILRDDIREDGEEWKRTKPTEKVDRRVQWASAHDLGISKGMLVWDLRALHIWTFYMRIVTAQMHALVPSVSSMLTEGVEISVE